MILYVTIVHTMDTTRYTDLELRVIDELETSIDPILMNEQEQWTEFVRIAHFVIGIEVEEVQEIYKKWFSLIRFVIIYRK